MLIADYALQFVYLHEIGHLVHGHLEIEAPLRSGDGLQNRARNFSGVTSVTRAIMEIDADMFASRHMAIQSSNPGVWASLPRSCKPTSVAKYAVVPLAVSVATSVLFHSLDIGTGEVRRNQHYPSPSVRSNVAVSFFLEHLQGIGRIERSRLVLLLGGALWSVERAYQSLGISQKHFDILDPSAIAVAEETDRIRKEHQAFTSLLSAHSRVKR